MTLRGDKNGRVTKKALFKTVALYECYIKDQRRLDKLFDQFDTDRSNELDADELLPMLRLGLGLGLGLGFGFGFGLGLG